MSTPDHIHGTIDRIEGTLAVIRFDEPDQLPVQELTVPRRLLPKAHREGTVLEVQFFTEDEATQARETVARKLLEEILNGK